MVIHKYRVGYHCLLCSKDHLADKLIQSTKGDLDGRPWTEAYAMGENAPEIQQFLATKRNCPNKGIEVVLKPADCYLEAPLPAQF